jgi:hypothetical protein
MTPMTERLLREVNLRIHQLARDFDGPTDFLCECGQPTCEMTSLEVHTTEFADIVATPGSVLVAPGHQGPGAEIVRERLRYLIVRGAAQPAIF